MKKARVETTPKKHRKRKKHRKGDQGLVDSSIFFIFLLGERKWESEALGGGGIGFFYKSQERGGGSRRGAEGPGGCLWRTGKFFGEGGSKNVFSGAETSTRQN